MININKLCANEKAFAKAAKELPSVLDKGNGTFRVLGVAGSFSIYTVVFGDETVACDCEGARWERACYHAAAAFKVYRDNQSSAQTQPQPTTAQQIDALRRVRHAEQDTAPYLKPSGRQVETLAGIRF